jgi:hypothetical protein
MSKVMDLPDDTTEEHLAGIHVHFVYPIGIKLAGEHLELHIDNGRI